MRIREPFLKARDLRPFDRIHSEQEQGAVMINGRMVKPLDCEDKALISRSGMPLDTSFMSGSVLLDKTVLTSSIDTPVETIKEDYERFNREQRRRLRLGFSR